MSATIGKKINLQNSYFNTYRTVKSQITVCPKLQEIQCLDFEEKGLKFWLGKVTVLKINFQFYLQYSRACMENNF